MPNVVTAVALAVLGVAGVDAASACTAGPATDATTIPAATSQRGTACVRAGLRGTGGGNRPDVSQRQRAGEQGPSRRGQTARRGEQVSLLTPPCAAVGLVVLRHREGDRAGV